MGEMQFNGTPEEWEALVKKNKMEEELKITNCGNKNCQGGVINGINPKICKKCNPKEEPKQETLEEAAEKYAKKYALSTRHISHIGFEDGAKWQQERMYSDEEVKVIVNKVRETGLTVEYLLLTEQFKKK